MVTDGLMQMERKMLLVSLIRTNVTFHNNFDKRTLSGGYCLLIAFFAVNGITEAFSHAVMVRVHFSAELDHVRCAQKEILCLQIPAELTTANKVLLVRKMNV